MNLSKFLALLVFVIAGKLAAQGLHNHFDAASGNAGVTSNSPLGHLANLGAIAYANNDSYGGGAGNSVFRNKVFILPISGSDTEAPTAPTNLYSDGTTKTSTVLRWTASTDNVGVKNYIVYQDGVIKGSTSGNTAITMTGLTSGKSYAFSVVARDAAGNLSSPSNIINVATLPGTDTEAPSAVTTLTASGITATSAQLTWVPSTDNVGVVSYEVYKDGVIIDTTPDSTYNIVGLSANTTYQISVLALDLAGNKSSSGNILELVTTDPGAIPYTSVNANLPTIDWHAKHLFVSQSLGIGISPVMDYKLAVAGNVIAEGVKVALQSQWPDYVFMENYKLPTLEEVENHIMEKGHLIHLPSAKEVEIKGIDLGEMDALLLRKIEELTLYILQQEKKIIQLENSNVELRLLSDKILNLEQKLQGTLLQDK